MSFNPIIGVIGAGVVGKAIAHGFGLVYDVKIYDADSKKSTHELADVCQSDFVFVCVPTPIAKNKKRHADLSIIKSVFDDIREIGFTESIYIIKSTVPVGTTKSFNSSYPDYTIVHNPEFLTAKAALNDFLTQSRVILGGDLHDTEPVANLYSDRFPGINILRMQSKESEAVKYMCNAFLAVKLTFFNEMYMGLLKYELGWNNIMAGILTDGRIGPSHTQVPGPDGKFGYSGGCFPKDICSLISQLKDMDFDPLLLEACREQNARIRPEVDL